jgi:hypothetical protein
MGADVKQSGEHSAVGEIPALAGQGGEPEILRRRAAAVQQGSGDLLLEIGIIKSCPT